MNELSIAERNDLNCAYNALDRARTEIWSQNKLLCKYRERITAIMDDMEKDIDVDTL